MSADVRKRFGAACKRLNLPVRRIAAQFDSWKYTDADLAEMAGWPDETIDAHCRLLYAEIGSPAMTHEPLRLTRTGRTPELQEST